MRAACSTELKRDLFDFLGGDVIDTLTEQELLDNMKTLAIQGKNKAVHRKEFYAMIQDPDQAIQGFVASLRSKAQHCRFVFRCKSDLCNHQMTSYAESMVEDQMVVGCADADTQENVLAKDAEFSTFQSKFDFIQATEQGKRAKADVQNLTMPKSTLAAHKSDYQRSQRQSKLALSKPPMLHEENTPTSLGCTGCGSKNHGKGTKPPRNLHCPAWNKICHHCNVKKSSVCHHKKASTLQHDKHHTEHKVFLENHHFTYCFFTYTQPLHSVVIPHMEWSDKGEYFVNSKPNALPKTNIAISLMADAHKDFGKEIPEKWQNHLRDQVTITACTDTGAQTCASGPDILHDLQLDREYLVPTSHKIIGVTQSPMNILGVILVKIEARGKVTHQVVYVSNNIKGFFLSEKTQSDLGILPPSYATPNTFQIDASLNNVCTAPQNTGMAAPCGCPARTPPPPRPDHLPFPPTGENRGKFEKWLLDYYSSSAFNTCEHQPLPKMAGKPMKIHFRPDAAPKAFHCPIPVPHHSSSQCLQELLLYGVQRWLSYPKRMVPLVALLTYSI